MIKIFKPIHFVLILTQLFFLPVSLNAQDAQAVASSATQSATQLNEGDLYDQDNLYFDYKGASLINVLYVLSQLTGINFVAGKEIASREVNMVLDNVKLEDVLDALQRGTNVTYEFLPNRNMYLFRASSDKADEPPLTTRVFKLYYIRASELREVEGGASSSSGGSSGGSSSDALSESKTTGDSNSQILKIVKNILSARGRVDVDDRSNSIVVTDSEDRLRMVESAIVQLDRPVDQVLINVILIETVEGLNDQLGVTWTNNTTTGSIGTITPGSTEDIGFPWNNPLHKLFDINADRWYTGSPATTRTKLDMTNMTVEFRALEVASKTKVLAKPRILVLDNHPALIKITTNATIGTDTVSTTIGSQNAGQSITTAERAEIGTLLRVTPLINTDGRITMTLEPHYSTQATSALITTRADPTNRSARTTMMVNSGQTIVLGGLMSSQQTTERQRVPFLGSIPGIGEIFTKRKKSYDDKELILFVTPFIIRDPSELQALSIPDERDRVDDFTAAPWKVKRKEWFRNLNKPSEKDQGETVNYIEERDRLMDEAVKKIQTDTSVQKSEMSSKQTVTTVSNTQAPTNASKIQVSVPPVTEAKKKQ